MSLTSDDLKKIVIILSEEIEDVEAILMSQAGTNPTFWIELEESKQSIYELMTKVENLRSEILNEKVRKI